MLRKILTGHFAGLVLLLVACLRQEGILDDRHRAWMPTWPPTGRWLTRTRSLSGLRYRPHERGRRKRQRVHRPVQRTRRGTKYFALLKNGKYYVVKMSASCMITDDRKKTIDLFLFKHQRGPDPRCSGARLTASLDSPTSRERPLARDRHHGRLRDRQGKDAEQDQLKRPMTTSGLPSPTSPTAASRSGHATARPRPVRAAERQRTRAS